MPHGVAVSTAPSKMGANRSRKEETFYLLENSTLLLVQGNLCKRTSFSSVKWKLVPLEAENFLMANSEGRLSEAGQADPRQTGQRQTD